MSTPAMSDDRSSASRSAFRPRLLAVAASLALFAAACGSGEDTVAASTDDGASSETSLDDSTSDETTPAEDDAPTPDGDDDGAGGDAIAPVAGESDYAPTLAMLDITGPTAHPIDEIVVSDDGMTIGVRYQAAAEPCSGAIAEAVEDDTTISVTLHTGLNPEAATMSCIAEVMFYELGVGLDAPVGDREIVLVDSDGTDADGTGSDAPDPGDSDGSGGSDDGTDDGTDDDTADGGDDEDGDGLSSPESFIGLSLDDASAKADAEGRGWRISRQDDEQFGLTADYIAERVTFEVDAGVVTAVVAG